MRADINANTGGGLTYAELLQLKRWNTPTIYNGWEQIAHQSITTGVSNLEETRGFHPQMGPMIGYAVTVVIQPSDASHRRENPLAWEEYRRVVAAIDPA